MSTSVPSVYDQSTWATRLVNTQPAQWFSDSAKQPGGALYSIMAAIGTVLSAMQQGLLYAYDANYVQTAVNGALDNASLDFYGGSLPRLPGESDSAFAKRILAGLFQPVGTLSAVENAITAVVGTAPKIYEPWDVVDMGFYDGSYFYDVPDNMAGGLRYTPNAPYECLVITELPGSQVLNGNPVPTYDGDSFYDSYTFAYADIPTTSTGLDALTAAISKVAPLGVAIWLQIGYKQNAPQV